MPALFCYAALWGPGVVLKNGQVLHRDRLVHGMLTEYVRSEDDKLDSDLNPATSACRERMDE